MDKEQANEPNTDTPEVAPAASKPETEHSVSSRPTPHYQFKIPGLPADMHHFDATRRNRLGWRIRLIVVVAIIGILTGFGGGWFGANRYEHNSTSLFGTGTTATQKEVVTSESQLINSIAKTVGPAVVSLNVTGTTAASTDSTEDDLFGQGETGTQTEQSAGTGIILSSDGLIMTSRHVVPEGTTSVSVTLSDGTTLNDVSIVGRTSPTDSIDVAFLKVNNLEGHKLTTAVIGDSSTVQVGDSVVAIGNALGQFQNSVTSGIISGYGRNVQASDSGDSTDSENLTDLFQTDAAINEGNSGGPLVNMNGQVIGINTAIAGDGQNIGFAIPINDVKTLIKEAETSGKIERPYLGVHYVDLTPSIASQYHLSVSQGAYIPTDASEGAPVISGSPADQAGVKAGDIITAVDGTTLDSTHSLTSVLTQKTVGQKIDLTINRNGKTIHIDVTLGSVPASS
jgi:serine protease Do